mmetsp:Transcript_6154/g.13386  ORF Transcript_6154/g.13386 Transcript_6154/m.13386 type:complete len:210 (+) Transcript_6154:858-1487(+)
MSRRYLSREIAIFLRHSEAPRSEATVVAAERCEIQSNRSKSGSCSSPACERACTTLCSITRRSSSGAPDARTPERKSSPSASPSAEARHSFATRRYIARLPATTLVPYLAKMVAAPWKSDCAILFAPCSVAYFKSMVGPCCCASSRHLSHSPCCAYASMPSETLPSRTSATASPESVRWRLYASSTFLAYCGADDVASDRACSHMPPAI